MVYRWKTQVEAWLLSKLNKVLPLQNCQMFWVIAEDAKTKTILVYRFLVPILGRQLYVAVMGKTKFGDFLKHLSQLSQRRVRLKPVTLFTEDFDECVKEHPILRPSDLAHLTIRFRLV